MPYDIQRWTENERAEGRRAPWLKWVLAVALLAAPCSIVAAESTIPIPPAGDEA